MDQSPFTRKLYEAGNSDLVGTPNKENFTGNIPHASIRSSASSLPSTPKHYQFRESATGINFKASPSTPKTSGFTPKFATPAKFGSPTTPNQSTTTPSHNGQSTPTGSWTHPSLKVIKQRGGVSKELMLKRVVYNGMGWLVFVLARSFITRFVIDWLVPMSLVELPADESPLWNYLKYLQYFVYGILATNIVQALFYLIQPQDKYSDLPLSAEQRELMGLPKLGNSSTTNNETKNIPTPPKYVRHSPGAMNFPSPKPRSRSNSTSSVGTISASPGNASVEVGNLSLGPSTSPLKRFNSTVVSSVSGVGSPLGNSTSTSIKSVAKSIQTTAKSNPGNSTMNISLSQSTPIGTPKTKSVLTQNQSFTPTGRYMYYSDSPRKA